MILSHVSLGVDDVTASVQFYDAVLAPLSTVAHTMKRAWLRPMVMAWSSGWASLVRGGPAPAMVSMSHSTRPTATRSMLFTGSDSSRVGGVPAGRDCARNTATRIMLLLYSTWTAIKSRQ